jgi:hypothetical protein
VTDYTDLVARFSERRPAETLAKFIASLGISCDLVEVPDAFFDIGRYGIHVSRELVPELQRLLKLARLRNCAGDIPANVLAVRLAREEIPCYIGGGAMYGPLRLGSGIVPLIETTEQGSVIFVPESMLETARQLLSEPPLSEEELTRLALGTAPSPDDPI